MNPFYFFLSVIMGWMMMMKPLATSQKSSLQDFQDTTEKIEILNYTKRLTLKTLDDSTRLTIIAGDVKLRQGTSFFYCDSCVLNNRTQVFEAWGRVHINDADTINIYSDYLRYLSAEKKAYLDGHVKLTDGKGTLTTPDLEYDMQTNIGIYKKGGKVVNKKTVLTSREGWYYADMKDVYFKKDVVLKDPAYNIVTDSLLYNTVTQQTSFISQTTITDSSGRIIKTKEGNYNQATGKAEFGQRPEIYDGKVSIIANRVAFDDSTGLAQAEGNAVIVDSVQGTTIIGGLVYQNRNTNSFLATRKPVLIIERDQDSTFVSADTLFSARLSDRFGIDSIVVDTATGAKAPAFNIEDSANRYFEAYHNVRIFNDSMQAASDSMLYSFRDSIFRLYDNPIIWSQNTQITGDTIYLVTKNKKPAKVQAFKNSFMINEVESAVYNQIKSVRMDGWFVEGQLDSVRAAGYAECIYYVQDKDSAYTGINETKSDVIDFYFEDKELDHVVFRSEVTGTLWPMRQKNPADMVLPGFNWQADRRPRSKFDIFE